MKIIVTGKFAAGKQAARAVDKLLHSCIGGDHVRAFFLNPSAPHAADPIGGRTLRRPSGILVAVETSNHVSQALAVNVLREHGARGIEHAAGAWQELEQTGFHPVSISTLCGRAATEGHAEDLGGITRH